MKNGGNSEENDKRGSILAKDSMEPRQVDTKTTNDSADTNPGELKATNASDISKPEKNYHESGRGGYLGSKKEETTTGFTEHWGAQRSINDTKTLSEGKPEFKQPTQNKVSGIWSSQDEKIPDDLPSFPPQLLRAKGFYLVHTSKRPFISTCLS
mmetsp:Transcript_16047/g.31364  ORF Transcript_16047/g.31364 Transcript_16047/m.31364 type:complete len:154 (+) Transcript_16047:142-603(+)